MVSKKSLAVVAAVAATGFAGIAGMQAVSAQADNTTGSPAGSAASGPAALIQKLAEKFNLNQDEVKAVFDEERQSRETERETERSERLQQAVDDGDITAEQKAAIEAKQKELKAAMDTERQALESWAIDNDIDAKYLMMSGPRGGGQTANNDRLQQAVDAGDITAEQKTLIEQKAKELQTKREASHTDLEKWATDNDIDQKYLMGGMKGGMMGAGHRGGPNGGPHIE